MGTLGQLSQKSCQSSTAYLGALRVKTLARLEKEQESAAKKVAYSLSLLESPEKNDLELSFWRTLKVYSLPLKEGISNESLVFWGKLGMYSNGKCWTANISVPRSIENESLLSDFLEKNAGEKYFLSATQTEKLFSKMVK